MKILFIGDVCARPGRQILKKHIPLLRQEYSPDIVIANVENAAHGLGIMPRMVEEFKNNGIDVMTAGNHLFDRKEIMEIIYTEKTLLRGVNYPGEVPGYGSYLGTFGGCKVLVMNLIGRTFMAPLDCPFQAFDLVYEQYRKQAQIIIVDIHAEATSEKIALAHYVDGRATAVLGTHTHVQTADEQILKHGTAFISDVGMTGPHDGIIGMKVDSVLPRFLTGLPTRFEPAENDVKLHAVLVTADPETGKATDIQRIQRT